MICFIYVTFEFYISSVLDIYLSIYFLFYFPHFLAFKQTKKKEFYTSGHILLSSGPYKPTKLPGLSMCNRAHQSAHSFWCIWQTISTPWTVSELENEEKLQQRRLAYEWIYSFNTRRNISVFPLFTVNSVHMLSSQLTDTHCNAMTLKQPFIIHTESILMLTILIYSVRRPHHL